MVLQSLVGVAILFKFNKFAGGVALASLILVAIYPTMKRLTSWPQVVLGLAFNWGALVGYAAVTGTLSWATVALYCRRRRLDDGLRHDLRHAGPARRRRRSACARPPGASPRRRGAGSRCSPCWRWRRGRWPATWLRSGPIISRSCWPIALHFVWQIAFLKPHDQADCLAKFKANGWLGLLLTAAVIAGHVSF